MTLYIHSNSFSRKLKIDTKCYYLLAITLHLWQQTWKFCLFVINNNKSFISQNLNAVGSLGGNFDLFSPSGFEIQRVFDYRTSKIKFYSVRALKCYLNEKNLIHGRVTATISKFSPQIFEMYIRSSDYHFEVHTVTSVTVYFLFNGKIVPWLRFPADRAELSAYLHGNLATSLKVTVVLKFEHRQLQMGNGGPTDSVRQ